MRPLSDNEMFIIGLFGLENEDIQSIEYIRDGNNAIVDVFLTPHPLRCPDCGYDQPKIKNYVLKKITHSILSDRGCTLHYHARRYVCPVCHRTYYEKNPFVFQGRKISIKTVINILTDLKKSTETFASVAERYHISPTSAASIFDEHVQISRHTLPEMINFDEVFAFRTKTSKFVCVLLDYQKQTPIDVLDSRHKSNLQSYFGNISIEERKKVRYCCSDMYTTYRDIVHIYFPNSTHCVDHYHMIQELNRKVDDVRIRIMKKYGTTSDEYYLLKKFKWMIYKNEESEEKKRKLKARGKLPLFDPNVQKVFNRRLNQYLNYYDIYSRLLKIHPDLTAAWILKDEVTDFYDNVTYDTASEKLDELIQDFNESGVSEMIRFSRTLRNWKQEIINSFIIVDYEYKVDKDTGRVAVRTKKMNNAIIENKNSIIKTIKKNANGYTNWNRFRNRIMYVLDTEATFRAEPLSLSKSKSSQ